MKEILFKTLCIIVLTSVNLHTQTYEPSIPPTVLLEYETKIEQQLTEHVQKNILDKVFGPGKSTVIIDITLGVQTQTTRARATEQKIDTKRRRGEIEYILPGIPKPGSVAESAVPQEAKSEGSGTEQVTINTEFVIRRQRVTVIHDEKIKEDKISIVKEAIISSLGIREGRDILEFKKAKFTSLTWTKFLESLLLPRYLIPLLLAMLSMLFLFGPLAEFLRSYVRAIREGRATEVSIESKMEGGGPAGTGTGGGGVGAGGVGLTEAEIAEKEKEKEKEEEEKYIPFSYINEENLKRLVYLIAKEPPEDIAIILSYLKPEHVKQIIESFKPELQAEVVVALAQAREVPQEKVQQLDNYVKERIDFLVGGIHRLLEILRTVDKTTRDNILEYLKNEKPEIYNKVRPQLFLFEDILEMPDFALQIVIRELKPENIARALRLASQELVNKFFRNMSEGAQALVREEMDYGRPMTREQIEEEQDKIVELILKLESEGKIFLKERPKTVTVDATEVKIETGKKERKIELSPGYEYYVEGVRLYESGDIENAINYLFYATELDPTFYEAYQYLGTIYYENGDYLTALE